MFVCIARLALTLVLTLTEAVVVRRPGQRVRGRSQRRRRQPLLGRFVKPPLSFRFASPPGLGPVQAGVLCGVGRGAEPADAAREGALVRGDDVARFCDVGRSNTRSRCSGSSRTRVGVGRAIGATTAIDVAAGEDACSAGGS